MPYKDNVKRNLIEDQLFLLKNGLKKSKDDLKVMLDSEKQIEDVINALKIKLKFDISDEDRINITKYIDEVSEMLKSINNDKIDIANILLPNIKIPYITSKDV